MKYYLYINEKLEEESEELTDIKDYVYDFIQENITEEEYDEILDEINKEVHIGICTFSASEILKTCDRIAYNMGMTDEAYYIAEVINYDLTTSYESTWSNYDFELIELPTELEIEKEELKLQGNETKDDLVELINEYLADYGYCDNGYKYEIHEDTIEVFEIEWDMPVERE